MNDDLDPTAPPAETLDGHLRAGSSPKTCFSCSSSPIRARLPARTSCFTSWVARFLVTSRSRNG